MFSPIFDLPAALYAKKDDALEQWNSEMVQQPEGLWFIEPEGGGSDVFVHITAVERAGLSTLNEGKKV